MLRFEQIGLPVHSNGSWSMPGKTATAILPITWYWLKAKVVQGPIKFTEEERVISWITAWVTYCWNSWTELNNYTIQKEKTVHPSGRLSLTEHCTNLNYWSMSAETAYKGDITNHMVMATFKSSYRTHISESRKKEVLAIHSTLLKVKETIKIREEQEEPRIS